jgi:hypothetical protein
METTDYGLRLAFKGFMTPEEIGGMNHEMARLVSGLHEGWGVLVDMRGNSAFSAEVVDLMKAQIGLCRENGMDRGAIVLQSAIMTLQARRITGEAGILPQIRFLDASADPGWEKTAIDWVAKGVEPPPRMMGG